MVDSWGDWITPDNIDEYGTEGGIKKTPSISSVACVTTDYGMQNIILQMGLRLFTVNGLELGSVRTWLFRCHACFESTYDMSKVFCPKCGRTTLVRVSVVIGEDGKAQYKQRGVYSSRGTKFAPAKPQGGRHSANPITREDMLKQDKTFAWKKVLNKESSALDSLEFGFGVNAKPRASTSGNIAGVGTSGRRNPNVVKPTSSKNKRNRRRK